MILNNLIEKKEKLPLLQYLDNYAREGFFRDFVQITRKKRMSFLYYRCPEAQGPIDGHARDICGSFHFEPVNPRGSGKLQIARAQSFVEKTDYKKKRFSWVKDALVTGDGFLFISELAKEYADQVANEFRKIDSGFDAVSFRARGLIPVASTTMVVDHNHYEVTGYTQTLYETAGGLRDTRHYPKDKIMHLTFDTPAGKVEGWTPLFSLPLHMELLWLLWSNQYDFQEKGNHADLIVMAEQLDRNRLAYEKVRRDLESYNQPGNSKHGTLLLSGDKFSVQQLERMDTLQFKEVGMFITSLIASVFHYPQSRLSIKTEESAKDKDSSGGNEKFYYNIVEQKQEILADLENKLFWIPYFGVRIVPDKSYKHDQIEEGTAQQLRITNLNTLIQMMNAQGFVISEERLLDAFNGISKPITQEDIKEGSLVPAQVESPQLSKDEVSPSGMSKNDRQQKKKDELNREKVDGKPNGITR